jgi:nitrogen permease regulator 2-like protein
MNRELLAVTYSEFDNLAGPQLLYCFPEGVLTKEAFEPVADYVILGKHLCERIITIKLEKFQLISYPIAIENNKYERNTLSFAFGFILSFNAKSAEYGKALGVLTRFFQTAEVRLTTFSLKIIKIYYAIFLLSFLL